MESLISPGIDRPYPATGGLFPHEAIMLLRRFYVQENTNGILFKKISCIEFVD